MISQKLEKAFNEQITAEMWSSNLYLSMSFHFEKEGFNGFANWLKKQSQEEMGHAYAMATYLMKRGGAAKVNAIAAVDANWGCPLDVFKRVYEHECHVSQLINNLLELAKAEKDYPTEDFLWGFVKEQVEEEASAQDIIDKIQKFGESAVFHIDGELNKR